MDIKGYERFKRFGPSIVPAIRGAGGSGEPDYANAQIGDEIGGGIYAGTITYADAREFHVVSAKSGGEVSVAWKDENTGTAGTLDDDDGKANTDAMDAAGLSSHPAAQHCLNYTDTDGNADYYMPALNELQLVYNSLAQHSEFSDNTASTNFTYASTQNSSVGGYAWGIRFSNGQEYDSNTKTTARLVRPIRRIPV